MALTLGQITDLLASDKIRERQEGLQAIEETFADHRKVERVDNRGWKVIFTAIFVAFGKEKQAATKKGTLAAPATSGPGATATGRLKETSKVLRALVARSVKKLAKKTTVVVLKHLCDNLKYHGALFQPVAHDYLRTIEILLQWKPHLDHLEPETWISLLELCLNILLDDSLKTRLRDRVTDDPREPSPSEVSGGEDGDGSNDEEISGSPSKKRRRGDSRVSSHPPRSTSKTESVKFVTIEKVAAADILAILLQSPSCPLQSLALPTLPAAILNRFQRLFLAYPKGSLHPPLLSALSTVLSHCILNSSQAVIHFSRNTWSSLAKLWVGGRDLREPLAIIIRMLLPFLTLHDERLPEFDVSGSLMKLWVPWTKELGDPKKLDLISLECIRLQLRELDTPSAFVARTFRFGWEFDARQAYAWALLELRADCAAKLYSLSETVHAVDSAGGKRVKLEDPVSALLSSIQKEINVDLRTYHLQCLLFLIDRHWSLFHAQLQERIITTLLQFIQYDDAIIQSWTLVCFSAVAYACATTGGPEPRHLHSSTSDSGPWDTIWTYAMRRSNVPRVCRAACHVAHTLLLYAKTLLNPNKVLTEIETFAKDLNIQGPSFPHDSVCSFLTMCMRIANQDVRLYRMQLEEKVLAWLTDSWRPTKVWSKRTMPPHTVSDVLGLLGTVCNVTRQPYLVCEMILPDCPIAEAMSEEYSTSVIRDLVLYARIPPLHTHYPVDVTQEASSPPPPLLTTSERDHELVPAGSRERRISAFLVKYLEEFSQDLDADKTIAKHTVERVRVTLDFTTSALCFESLLVANGIMPNRRVVQAACKAISACLTIVTESRWTWNERLFILASLDPLFLSEPSWSEVEPWELILPAGPETGIRQDVLRRLSINSDTESRSKVHARQDIQKALFSNSDVQEVLPTLLDILRQTLQMVGTSVTPQRRESSTDQAKDGFEFRVSNETKNNFEQDARASGVLSRIVRTCVGCLATFPLLQSSSQDPIRDEDLFQLVIASEDDAFYFLADTYFRFVRRRILHMSPTNLKELMEKIGSLGETYSYSSWEGMRLLAVSGLRSTISIWASSSDDNLLEAAQELWHWLSHITLQRRHMLSWRVADAMTLLLDDYLQTEPSEISWPVDSETESQGEASDSDEGPGFSDEDSRHSPKSRKNSRKYKSPHGLLHRLSCDPDIRVRLRAVVASARSFNVAPVLRIEPKDWYNSIREELCKDPEDVEGITTRLICLGNIIIVNSPVRRGAYWHFLELCLHTSAFNRHIEAISRAVAERMGMTVASLFEAYASQIAWSIRETQQQDFLRLPFHLLGYRSMEECAQAAARAFSATNLLTTGKKGDSGVEQYGRRLFKNHCQVLKQDIAPMLREYVEEIVGRQIAYWIHSSLYPAAQEKPEPLVRKWDDLRVDDPELKSLESYLSSLFVEFGTHVPFTQHLRPYTDGVIASMIRTIGDQDFSAQGPVVGALEQMPGASAETFLALMRFRTKTYHEHEAALPAFDSIRTLSALKSLEWLNAMVPHADDVAVTYHVLHHLFAALECNPLVGKQLQLLNVIGIWISCRHEHFTDQSVMKTLLNGAVNILPQIDLAFGAQSMLDWAFAQLLLSTHNEDSATCLDTRLTEVLLRIGCVAFGFETQRTPEVSQGGSAILDWIESHIVDLYRVRRWRSQIIRALAAWPRELSEKLQSFSQKATLADLSQFLQDAPMSTNKFRVVRRLHQVAVSKSYEHEQFAKSDFWRLKACIPPEGLLSIDDVHSFAALLLSCRGHIDGLENENIITQSARTLHIRYSTEKSPEGGSNRVLAPRQAILVSLLHMLESASASQVYLAFRTLRSLASATSVDTVGSGAWPKGLAEELNLLKAYSGQTTSSSPSDLREMLRSEEAIQPDSDFAQWVTFIASTLCHPLSRIAPFYVPLISMVREDPSFAEEVLPVLVQTLLQLERSAPPQPDPHKAVLSEYFSRLLLSDSTPVSRRHVIVDTVLHLRHFRPAGINDPLGHDKWLDIDYTLLSRSAVLCGAYTTGLLFTELAAENDMDPAAHSRTTEQVLYEIYTHVDEPDGFYGIETDDLYAHLLKRLHHEHQWQKAFQFHGAALNTRQPVNVNAEGMLQSLHAFGFNNLAMTTLQALPELDDNLDLGPMTYNLGWRTETWDLPAQTPDGGGLSLYLALRAVHRERDDLVVSQVVHQSLLGEMGRLRSLGDENTTEIREVAQNLLCLNEIRSWQLSGVQDKLRRKHLDISSMTDLSQVDQNVEYPLFEALIATRISLLHSSRYKEEREQVGSIRHPFAQSLVDIETKCLVQLSEASRKARNNQVALNSIICAKQLCSDSRFDVSQEFAQTLWSSKEPRTAKLILEKLVSTVHAGSQMKEMPSKIELAGLYALLGTWASEACLDKADIIKSRYFDTAISLSLKEDGDLATQSAPMHARIFHRFASFAERQYNTLLKSPDAIRLKLLADSKKEEVKKREQAVARLEANSAARQRASRDLERAQKIMVLDENQIKEQNEMRDAFLEQAITMHSYALSASDEFDDDCAIRLCSLWLSNFDHPDNSLQTSIGSALRRVSSRKFVFLAHQLTARLAKVGDATRKGEALQQGNLQDVILRMCMEHPFHSMFPVFCLCPEPSSSSRRQSSNRHDHTPSQQARSDAASDISQRLRNDPSCKERVNAVIKVCEASLEWAKHPITQANRGERPRQIPEKMKILSVVDVKVPVLTAYTPIDPECSYENCVWIARFEKTYDTAGGVNLPKISKCIGSDGKKYKQLYKGQGADDLRQDAVMEQVFDLVNVVLRRDRETIRRNLRMRGYKVIPLAPQAGVIEFVGNTLPLNLWLSSMKSHERYRPQDIKPEAFARLMRSARPKKQEPLTAQEQAVLTDLFVDTRQNFKPVMRHFFTEQHKHPKSWFRMRLNYARSAAVTSIVGHVLGLGDRHLSNILIDTQSGELVHIDLGIAFEQGKLLPIPERVPFRLTADMVDGLGTTGVNGVFRKCGEETLRVLQSGAEVILTVLEVFKYDPLHSWVASDMKIRRMQPGTSDANSELAFEAFKLAVGLDVSTNTAGIAATRALNSVTRKLDKNLSVEETVDTLIAEATDVANLANMYIGWAPHL